MVLEKRFKYVSVSNELDPVSEMTYTVSSGTLNSTIPYHNELDAMG